MKLRSFASQLHGAAIPPKQQGSALLISILLSGLMLSVGIMAARLAVSEVEMSADLFLSEKAYFSAESGVERALWQLKDQPLSHVVPSPGTVEAGLEDDNTEVSIKNRIEATADSFHSNKFEFTLTPLQSQKFRFRYDSADDIAFTENTIAGQVELQTLPAGKFFWRFLCEDSTNRTIALQAEHNGSTNNLLGLSGKDDNGNDYTFNAWPDAQKDTCYLSIQNLSGTDQTYTFSGATMAPHAAHIHAVGQHQGRQKHIRFDYAQKTLGSLFDFSFLHSEGGL